MALILKDLLNSDTFETLVKKFNFNFDQIQANGGGPIGNIGHTGSTGLTGPNGINGTFWHIATDLTTFLASSTVFQNNDLILLTEPCTYLSNPYIKGDIFRVTVTGSTKTIARIGNIKPDITITPTGTTGILETIYNGEDEIYHRNSTEMDKIPIVLATEDTTGTSSVLTQFRNFLIAGSNKSAAYLYGNDSTIGGGKLTFLYGIGTGAFTLDEITNAPYIQGTINSDKLSILISSNHNIRNKFNDSFFISDNAGTDIFSINRNTLGTIIATNIQFTNSLDNFNIGSDSVAKIFNFSPSKSEFYVKSEWYNTDYIKITSGTTAQRPVTGVKGMMRYNSTNNVYEGYINTWIPLQGVYDSDGDTYIDVDITSDSDTMKFYTGSALAVQIKANQRTNFQNHVEMRAYRGIMYNDQLWSGGVGSPTPIPEIERTLTDYRYIYNRTGMNANGAGGTGQNFYHSGVVVIPTIVKSVNTYNKVGMGVNFNLHLVFTVLANMSYSGGTADSPITLRYLPYTATTGTGNYVFTCALENITLNSDIVSVVAVLDLSVARNVIRIKGVRSNGTMRDVMLSDCKRDGTTTNSILISGFYMTDMHSFDDPFLGGPAGGAGSGFEDPGGPI